ncbi:MAG: glutamine--tRNA ligase [Planctomycetes bacterium]|jgi:glutaminyl-tRNA synthetase|nr:glutamine--tRNA ligase [Planctomycetota bacterium]
MADDREKDSHEGRSVDFVRGQVRADVAADKNGGRVVTRFPPEPNGFLHIGHAKAICLNFDLADEEDGRCNLRFDDTNPAAEEDVFVQAIKQDISWLGYDWGDEEFYASGYFEKLYEWAEDLIRKGCAYVCDLSGDLVREYRAEGKNSPQRDRSVEDNLELFRNMRAGEYSEGKRTLRAKIDMASPNMTLRDPVMYRINHTPHHRTGTQWCIYPTYDWAHGQSDAIEGVTHSLCSLEFENHRPLYEWCLEKLEVNPRPRQIEFARLNLTYTVLSKRKLRRLVEEKHVEDWDDPRMPTLRGLRRRGYTPSAIRTLCQRVGVAKFNSTIDIVQLENALREELNKSAPRRMAVLDPLEVVIENYPDDREEFVDAVNNPEDQSAGRRKVPFSKVLWIERGDFREEAPRKYFRLKPGKEVRLRYGYYVTCTGFEKNAGGEVTRVICTYDPETRGGDSADGRKVRGTIHWVSARHAFEAEVRLIDHLFRTTRPEDVPEGADFLQNLNPDSLTSVSGCKLEPGLAEAFPGELFQFERHGYFCVDSKSLKGSPVFLRTVALRDSWAKLEKKLAGEESKSCGA